jgi:hypothetical protein
VQKAVSINKHYKGVLHKDSLRWCHGSVGLEHEKERRFRYPLFKYVQVYQIRVIVCTCRNCNMIFYDQESWKAPLKIPVYKHPSTYFYHQIPVSVKGKYLPINEIAQRKTMLGWATQEMINEDTRNFIEKVQ